MWATYKFGTLANKLEDAIEALMANDQPIGVIDYGEAGGQNNAADTRQVVHLNDNGTKYR